MRHYTSNQSRDLTIPTILRSSWGGIRWTLPGNTQEQDEQLAKQQVQAIFLNGFPHFYELFLQNEGGIIDEVSRLDAELFILNAIGNKKEMIKLFGNTPLLIRSVPYFGGSPLELLRKSFSAWRLSFEMKARKILPGSLRLQSFVLLPIPVDDILGIEGKLLMEIDTMTGRQTGKYIDESTGQIYANFLFLHGKHGVSSHLLNRLLKDVPSIKGAAKNRRETTLYKIELAEEKINYYLSLPKVDKGTGIFIDDNNRQWTLSRLLENKFGVDNATVRSKLQNIPSQQGRDSQGKETILYDLLMATAVLEPFAIIKQQSQQDNNENQRWQHKNTLSKLFGISSKTLEPYLESIPTRQEIAENRQEITFYDAFEVKERLKDFLALPRTNRQTGTWVDENCEEWAPTNYFRKKYNLNSEAMTVYLEGVSNQPGRTDRNLKTTLYRVSEVMKRIEESQHDPKVAWLKMSEEQKISFIEKEARLFLEKYGRLDQKSLSSSGYSWLQVGISRFYPKGLVGLREKLGIRGGNLGTHVQITEETNTKPNIDLSDIQQILLSLPQEQRREIADAFAEYIKDPNATMLLHEFALDYLRRNF